MMSHCQTCPSFEVVSGHVGNHTAYIPVVYTVGFVSTLDHPNFITIVFVHDLLGLYLCSGSGFMLLATVGVIERNLLQIVDHIL